MPDISTIRSYLVELGFKIHELEKSKFAEALKQAAVAAERSATSMAKNFIAAGGAIATSMAGIATGTVALMDETARADLGYQLLARRLFTTTEAARKMKMSTDALGYSINDILWGPPELFERYQEMNKLQDRLLSQLGPGFEKAMRNIRDVRQEFGLMGLEIKYLGLNLVERLSNTILGDGRVRKEIRDFNEWLLTNIPQISDSIVSSLTPALDAVGTLLKTMFSKENLDKMEAYFNKLTTGLALTANAATNALKGQNPAYGPGAIWDKNKSIVENLKVIGPALLGIMPGEKDKDELMWKVVRAAKARGIDPAIALATIDQETGGKWNPDARGAVITNPKSKFFGQRALGLGQIMQGNIPAGVNPFDPDQNIAVMMDIIARDLAASHGNLEQFTRMYHGGGKAQAGDASPDDYYKQFSGRYKQFQRDWGDTYKPQSYRSGGVDVGGVTVNITQPNATPEQIHSAVVRAIKETLDVQTQRTIAQHQVAIT